MALNCSERKRQDEKEKKRVLAASLSVLLPWQTEKPDGGHREGSVEQNGRGSVQEENSVCIPR